MFNTDLIYRTRWQELIDFFAQGQPPLALKLLILNTIFLVIFVSRRASAKHKLRPTTVYAVQGVLIAVNFAVMFATDLLPVSQQFKQLF